MIQDEIEQLIKPSLEALGYVLWGTEYLIERRHAMLRVYIDKDLEGIAITDCERASRQISAVLDVSELIADAYHLEVSSPGIPRPLFSSWQYQRYLGQSVQIKLRKPDNLRKNMTGIIAGVTDSNLSLAVENDVYELSFSNIQKARLIDNEAHDE